LVRARSTARPGRAAGSINAQIGDRLRLLRHARNLNQAELGRLIGVTAQQIHRYERGKSALAADNLWRLARALDAPPSYFFDGIDEPRLRTG
jgi:transcriptional regulator with XRE-family HTH domain